MNLSATKASIACLALAAVAAYPTLGLTENTEQPERRAGLYAGGMHAQLGVGVLETVADEPTRAQFHPRLSLRYDTSAHRSYRLTGRHQRLSGDNGGHAELTLSPSILHAWKVAQDVRFLAGVGLSLGAFTRFRPPSSDQRAFKEDYAIPVTGEVAGALSWQWRRALSLELSVDYRPVLFSDGDLEHVYTQSLSLSLDI